MKFAIHFHRIKIAAQIILLCLFAIYQAAGVYETFQSLSNGREPLRAKFGNIFWPARWQMFTQLSQVQKRVVFEGKMDGKWQKLPMEEWFPEKWESGYRWERPPFYRSAGLQRPFLAAACNESGAQATRVILYTWPRVLGTSHQPMNNARRKTLSEWSCDRAAPWPGGKII